MGGLVAGFVGYQLGRAVTHATSSMYYNNHNYYFGSRYMPSSGNVCSYTIPSDTNFTYEDHTRVDKMYFVCDRNEVCCELDCCYGATAWYSWLLLVLFLLILVCCCMCVGRHFWRRNRQNKNNTATYSASGGVQTSYPRQPPGTTSYDSPPGYASYPNNPPSYPAQPPAAQYYPAQAPGWKM